MNFKILNHKMFICCLLSGLVLTGCSSNRVMGETTRDLFTKYESGHQWTTFIEDEVIAFGKPAIALPSEPMDSIIIAGKQYSYVINKGGAEFVQLLNQLNPQYIQISRDLDFIAPAPDSNRFRGQFRFTYTPPNGNFSEKEQALFKQYGVAPCDCIDTQKPHTFELSLEGTVYPVVSNLKSLQPLAKPYRVKIQYLDYKSAKVQLSTKEKLAHLPLLPFTLTLDAIVLPSKVLGIIYQP